VKFFVEASYIACVFVFQCEALSSVSLGNINLIMFDLLNLIFSENQNYLTCISLLDVLHV
jgi:hypothetical protein